MAVILKELVKGYRFLFEDLANPAVNDWFLMGNPFPGLAIIGLYLWVIKDFGPKFMEHRKPYQLNRVIQVYNLMQIFLSGYTCFKLFKHGWWGRYSYRCTPVGYDLTDPEEYEIGSMMHLYFLTKIIDLLDTIFFTLRKKYNQISFLHLYHHAGMVALSWGATTWYTTGHGTLLAAINSFVHTLLYSYYFVTSVKSDLSSAWWKKYITKVQLAQFLYISIHFGQLVFHNPCNFPGIALMVVIPQNVFIFILFADFYYKAYIKKKPEKIAKTS